MNSLGAGNHVGQEDPVFPRPGQEGLWPSNDIRQPFLLVISRYFQLQFPGQWTVYHHHVWEASLLCSHLQHPHPLSSTQTCTFYFPSPLFNFPISLLKSIKTIDGYDFAIGGWEEHAPLRKKSSLCHLVGSTQEPLVGTGEQSDIDRQPGQTDGTRALRFAFLVTVFVWLMQTPLNHCCLF